MKNERRLGPPTHTANHSNFYVTFSQITPIFPVGTALKQKGREGRGGERKEGEGRGEEKEKEEQGEGRREKLA